MEGARPSYVVVHQANSSHVASLTHSVVLERGIG